MIDHFLSLRPNLRPGTVAQYRIAYSHWCRLMGEVEPSDDTVLRFMALLLEGRTPQTVNKTVRHLAPVFLAAGYSVAWRPYREPQRAPVAFLDSEFRLILDAAAGESGDVDGIPAAEWWRALLLALWYSGARIGAVLAVRSPDVLPDRGFYVRATHQKQHADQFFAIGNDAAVAFRRIFSPSRPVMWPWPWRRETLYDRFQRICGRAGLECYGTGNLFHRIRKSTASYMKANGGDPTTHLGHSAASVTRRYFDPRICGGHDARAFLPTLGY
jgi:integrase